MPYFVLNTCPTKHPELCCIHKPPEGLELLKWKLSRGEAIGADYPKEAAVHMAKNRGVELGGLVSNTVNLVILHVKIVDLMLSEHTSPAPIDIHHVIIYNHKGRIASSDYRIVNPLGALDCLDANTSVINRMDNGKVTSVPKPILSRRLIDPKRAFFRIATDPYLVVGNQSWMQKIKTLGFETSNVYATKLDEVD